MVFETNPVGLGCKSIQKNSEARNRFQYTKIEREIKNNNVYHYPGLEFQYNQLSF